MLESTKLPFSQFNKGKATCQLLKQSSVSLQDKLHNVVTAMGALQQCLQLAATAEVPLGRTFCLAEGSLQHDVTTGHRWPNSFLWAHVQPQAVPAATVTMKGGVEAWLV